MTVSNRSITSHAPLRTNRIPFPNCHPFFLTLYCPIDKCAPKRYIEGATPSPLQALKAACFLSETEHSSSMLMCLENWKLSSGKLMRYQRAQTYETTLAAHRSMQHQFRSLRLRFDAEKHCDVLFPLPPFISSLFPFSSLNSGTRPYHKRAFRHVNFAGPVELRAKGN